MEKQIVRQLQKSGNGMSVRVPPKVCEMLQADKGDNLSFEFEPDSGVVKLSKVIQPNPNPDPDNVLDETHRISEYESKVDEADKKTQSQQIEKANIGSCSNCGSEKTEVTDIKYYCPVCEATMEITPKGTTIIEMNPSRDSDKLESRIDQIEQDVQDIDEQLNNKSDESDESDEDDWLADYPWGKSDEAKVAVGAESDEDEDDL